MQTKSTLLLADDDPLFREILADALGNRGFAVLRAASTPEAIALLRPPYPDYAVVDLQMPGPSGLELIQHLAQVSPATRTVVLTGYASVATAVEAIKLGAIHYLTKPADADEIVAAFTRAEGDAAMPIQPNPISVNRMEWEHIQKVLIDCDGNISEAARLLGLHRRTLQRKLKKHPVRQ